MIMFLTEHNLPFLLLDHFTKLLPSHCPDSQIAKRIKCRRKKGTHLCTQVIAPKQLLNISSDLNATFFFNYSE